MQTCTMHILSLHGGGSILEVVRLEDVMIDKLFNKSLPQHCAVRNA